MGVGVPTAALQAGVGTDDESSSFIMMRHLSKRLSSAITPKWIKNLSQPIAIPDAVHYLTAAAALSSEVNRAFELGGVWMPYTGRC